MSFYFFQVFSTGVISYSPRLCFRFVFNRVVSVDDRAQRFFTHGSRYNRFDSVCACSIAVWSLPGVYHKKTPIDEKTESFRARSQPREPPRTGPVWRFLAVENNPADFVTRENNRDRFVIAVVTTVIIARRTRARYDLKANEAELRIQWTVLSRVVAKVFSSYGTPEYADLLRAWARPNLRRRERHLNIQRAPRALTFEQSSRGKVVLRLHLFTTPKRNRTSARSVISVTHGSFVYLRARNGDAAARVY